jgi:hypothetical protein
VLSVPLSKEQRAAIPKGYNLVEEKIALEGFVFLINPENPVKSLTQAEIRDIYSGKITNWSEVGGDDAEIIAYQRNSDSGSQTYMTEFMGDTPLVKAPKERVQGEMGGMITMLSSYDNSKYAIGYSVYSYAAEKQANAANITLLAVDGISPSRETFTDKSYPLLSATYAFYSANNENPRVKKLVDYLKTEAGQKVVADAGYYPVLPLQTGGTPYAAKGTGKAKPKNYKPVNAYSDFRSYFLDDDEDIVNCLTNEKLKENIIAYLSKQPEDYNPWVDVKNGYISFSDNGETAVFDMFTGERITRFSDLFYKDADFVPLINEVFSDWNLYRYEESLPQKNDFVGFLEEPGFSLSSFSLSGGNNYYFENEGAPYYSKENDRLLDLMVLFEYRDMSQCFLPQYREYIEYCDYLPYYTEEGIWKDGEYYYQVESRYEDVAAINSQLMRACESFYAADNLPRKGNLSYSWEVRVLDNCFQFYDYKNIYFDRATGEMLTISDLFKDGFTEQMVKEYPDIPKSVFIVTVHFNLGRTDNNELVFVVSKSDDEYSNYIFYANTDMLKDKYADIYTDSYFAP